MGKNNIYDNYNGGTSYSCTDECMPKEDKLAAMTAIFEVNRLLWKYSD